MTQRLYRDEFGERLDHILGQLDQGTGYLRKHRPDSNLMDTKLARNGYRKLKRVLGEVDSEARRSRPVRLPG